VRAAPGSSLLKDVALLKAGDSFGELCLLVRRHYSSLQRPHQAIDQWCLSGMALYCSCKCLWGILLALQIPCNSSSRTS
jgi:hypothetical protein